MVNVIRGTTPTITYNFQTVAVADIAVAFLTIKGCRECGGSVMIEKSLQDATAGNASLSWQLTQQETLAFEAGEKAKMMLNFRLADGTRGASNEKDIQFLTNHITEVI